MAGLFESATMTEPYILKMRPYLRKKVWGGRKLADVFGKPLPDASPYGEAWEVSDLAEGQSFVTNGPLAGQSLGAVIERWGTALTGPDGAAFPLLVKVLDAQDDLSVQVHPGDDDIARLDLDADSKDECWLILHADDDGCVLHGFTEASTPADFRMAVEENRAAEALRRVSVQAGDVIRVAPGTIHAICKGVVLLEVQQPSDTTYRVYDYNRPGMDGNPRELHLEQAMQVSNFDVHEPAKLAASPSSTNPSAQVLVDVDAYRIEKATGFSTLRWTLDDARPQVIFAGAGRVRLTGGRHGVRHHVELAYGQTAVIPAGLGEVVAEGADGAELIVASMGGGAIL